MEDGEVLVYRLFDVADPVDLQRAEVEAAAPRSCLRLSGVQPGSALEFPPAAPARAGKRRSWPPTSWRVHPSPSWSCARRAPYPSPRPSGSYLADDLAVVHWNCAFVSEPSGVEDIPDLMELATAQLLELRDDDALLDRELHRIYDEIEARGRPLLSVLTPRYRALQRRTAALLLELSEMIEGLENAVKIVGDLYLARLYQGAVRRFRLPAWQETVLRKQRLVAEANELIGAAADTSRAEWLEAAVIVPIAFEIVAALR